MKTHRLVSVAKHVRFHASRAIAQVERARGTAVLRRAFAKRARSARFTFRCFATETRLALGFVLLLLGTVSLVFAGDVTGTWKASFTTPDGQTRENTFVFEVDGEKLTGTVSSPRGESQIQDGTAKGDDLTFSVVRHFGGNEMKFNYKGKLAKDEIHFTVEAGERSFEMTAKRASQ